MDTLTREQILAAARNARIERAPMTIPELGGLIFVRGFSGKERDAFEEGLRIRKGKRIGQNDLRNFRAKFAVQVIVTKDGERILADDDAAIFGGLHAGVLDRIISRCQELSGTTDEEIEDMGNASGSGDSGAS